MLAMIPKRFIHRKSYPSSGDLIRNVFLLLVILLLSNCVNDDIVDRTGSGEINVTVHYDGNTLISRMVVAVFDQPDNPPVKAPIKAFFDPTDPVKAGLSFPYAIKIGDLLDGNYWLILYGDADPDDGEVKPTPNDPQTDLIGPITILNSSLKAVEVSLKLPDHSGESSESGTSAVSSSPESTGKSDITTAETPAGSSATSSGSGAETSGQSSQGDSTSEPDLTCLGQKCAVSKDCTCDASICIPKQSSYAGVTQVLVCSTRDCTYGDDSTCPPGLSCVKVPKMGQEAVNGAKTICGKTN
jgi:hypothetical protein